MRQQVTVETRDSFIEKLYKANALIDVLSNCRAEQLNDETVPCIADMLSEIIEALEGLFHSLVGATDENLERPRGRTSGR